MKKLTCILGLIALIVSSCSKKDSSYLSLEGEWYYKLDKDEIGEREQWFNSNFTQTIMLPGALRDYNIGDELTLFTDWTGSIYDSSWYFNPAFEKYRKEGNIKFPFWLTPVKHYKGMAWYQREINIPDSWLGKKLTLELERPHWQTKIWIDDSYIGADNSLSVPHRFHINTDEIGVGRHQLTVMVDNKIRSIDPGINSHSISDHTQGNWNGIIGDIRLYVHSQAVINRVKLTPKLKEKKLIAEVHLKSDETSFPDKLNINVSGINHKHSLKELSYKVLPNDTLLSLSIDMGDNFKTWSEFDPNLYNFSIAISKNGKELYKFKETFGMREFTIDSLHFAINNIPIFLRGTTECSVFPLTGYPPTQEANWDSIYAVCKAYGLNHVRFHSYCPPEAAFIAADKAGIYLQVEGPSWAKYSTGLGYGEPIDQYLMDETKRIIDEYGNHPSFVMMAYGNEPSGRYVDYLENWVDHFRRYDSRFLYTGASTGRSWAIIENSDFIVRSPPRDLAWKNEQPESLFDYRDKTEGQQRPYVTFEMGQWCVFPNFKEIDKYTGSLKAKNLELFQEDLSDKGMANMSDKFLMASGKLQAACYKEEIESTLRTPNLAGFQLLSLNDFSGQGTALVGVLDAFWDEKGYINSTEFSSFCNQIVPLVRLPKFVFKANEQLEANIEIANFSGKILNTDVNWQLFNQDGLEVKSGIFKQKQIPIGQNFECGKIELPLVFISKAQKLTLKVNVDGYSNDWSIFVYPTEEKQDSTDVYVTHIIDAKAEKLLQEGKKVLLMAAGKVENGKDVVHYHVPVFWNTSWFGMRPPHTTGLFIENKHPLFNQFPTDFYTEHQWWEVSNRQQCMNLEKFPQDFQPLVQPIDTWFLNRKLAMLFEANVAKGKLIVCSMDLETNIKEKPVAMRLYNSLISYMQSDKFNPKQKVDLATIKELFEKKDRLSWNSFTNENPVE